MVARCADSRVRICIAAYHSHIFASPRPCPTRQWRFIAMGWLESKTAGRVQDRRANASAIPIMCMQPIWTCLAGAACSNFSQLHARAWARRLSRNGC
jgi:hypothetical protein